MSERIDGAAELSRLSGIPKPEVLSLWEQVKENLARISACKQHRFDAPKYIRLGIRYKCLNCGGELQLSEIGKYIEGYEAAGKSADDIWPGFRQ